MFRSNKSGTKLINMSSGQPYDTYIGRPSKWGNPYSHKFGTLAAFKVATREDAIARYREWVLKQPDLIDSLCELKGKTLACWCFPLRCHGDVLLELIDEYCQDCETELIFNE